MEREILWPKYDAMIVSRAKSYAATHLFDTKTVDADDLAQEGRLVLMSCTHRFDRSLHDPQDLQRAFERYFMRALTYKFMTISIELEKRSTVPLLDFDRVTDPNCIDLALDFVTNVQTKIGHLGTEYVKLCLDTPENIQATIVNSPTARREFRRETERSLQITGRRRARLNTQLEHCLCG